MSIKPIDIQTLFVKLNQVGKDQANIKTAAMVSKNVEAKEQTEEGLRNEHTVGKINDDNDIAKVDNNDEPNREKSGDSEDNKEDETDSPPAAKKNLFVHHEDPDVGKNIDVKS